MRYCRGFAVCSVVLAMTAFIATAQQANAEAAAEEDLARMMMGKKRPRRLDGADKRIIFFLHIHKSGGSTMCTIAMRNGMRTTKGHNCNVQKDQRCCGDEDTMEAQTRFAETTRLNFVAVEKQMYEAMDLEHYFYVVTLRNSRNRYMSHYGHVRSIVGAAKTGTFSSWWGKQPDNWNVRQLCGTRCMARPKHQLSPEDWQYTLDRIQSFDSILFLEAMEASLEKFCDKVGWKKRPKIHVNKARKPHEEEQKQEWDPLMTALDDALYEFAQGLEERTVGGGNETENAATEVLPAMVLSEERQAMVDKYFAAGEESACTNPCCAEKCSVYL